MLEGQGLHERVARNQKLDSATGHYLVNQIRAGSLDAVIVYRSNGMANPANLREHLDLVEIDAPDSTAVQPFAMARDTRQPWLVQRFLDTVQSDASREQFESVGFRWRVE